MTKAEIIKNNIENAVKIARGDISAQFGGIFRRHQAENRSVFGYFNADGRRAGRFPGRNVSFYRFKRKYLFGEEPDIVVIGAAAATQDIHPAFGEFRHYFSVFFRSHIEGGDAVMLLRKPGVRLNNNR